MPAELLQRFRLTNIHGWTLVYQPCGDQTVIERWYRGAQVGVQTVSTVEARRHYACQLKAGFTATEKF